MALKVWDEEFKQYIPFLIGKKLVAWRWRHCNAGPWTYGEDRPGGPSIHLFTVEPLFIGEDAAAPNS